MSMDIYDRYVHVIMFINDDQNLYIDQYLDYYQYQYEYQYYDYVMIYVVMVMGIVFTY